VKFFFGVGDCKPMRVFATQMQHSAAPRVECAWTPVNSLLGPRTLPEGAVTVSHDIFQTYEGDGRRCLANG